MDALRFDNLLRALSTRASRRGILGGLAGGLFVAGPLSIGGMAAKARKKHKRKTRKPALNAFGCLNVGQACAGNDSLCCSGICEGNKPKKGKKDKSRCVAHNTGDCTVALGFCTVGTSSACGQAGAAAYCMTTTGNAGFCGHTETFEHKTNCRSCSKDTDCEAMTGPGSACVILDGGQYCTMMAYCKAHGSSKGTACIPPSP